MTLAEKGRYNLVLTLLDEIRRAKILGKMLPYIGDPDSEAEAKLNALADDLEDAVRAVATKHDVTLTED